MNIIDALRTIRGTFASAPTRPRTTVNLLAFDAQQRGSAAPTDAVAFQPADPATTRLIAQQLDQLEAERCRARYERDKLRTAADDTPDPPPTRNTAA
ncbi:MAG: hypothetical protein ABIU96_04070 [Rhodanobacter sp.]